MSNEYKKLAAELAGALEELPDEVKADLTKDWTQQAIGAKKVCDLAQGS